MPRWRLLPESQRGHGRQVERERVAVRATELARSGSHAGRNDSGSRHGGDLRIPHRSGSERVRIDQKSEVESHQAESGQRVPRYDGSVSTDIVLIHGYPLDRTVFSQVTPHLDARHRVLTPDLLGFGEEPWPADGDLSMEAQARHVFGAMDDAGIDEAVVVGLSMGGYVALAMVDLTPARVTGLGLIGSKPEDDTGEAKQGRDSQAATVVAEGSSVLVRPMTEALVADDAGLSVKARLRTMIERTRTETFVSALAGMRDRPDRSGTIERFSRPFAIQVGTADPILSSDRAHEIGALAPDGAVAVVDGVGHLIPLEDPHSVVDFVSDLLNRVEAS